MGVDYAIRPHLGAGEIAFGMTPNQVRALLGDPFESFKRSPLAEFPCDHFESLGIFVYYQAPGIVEALEYHQPASPTLDGISLLATPVARLISLATEKDPGATVEDDSVTCLAQGWGAWLPDAEDHPDRPAESIIVFRRGYYD